MTLFVTLCILGLFIWLCIMAGSVILLFSETQRVLVEVVEIKEHLCQCDLHRRQQQPAEYLEEF